jgi:hypothetical protein
MEMRLGGNHFYHFQAFLNIKPTSAKEREELKKHQFIHITGLTYVEHYPQQKRNYVGNGMELAGVWGCDNSGNMFVITTNKEVWFRQNPGHAHKVDDTFLKLIAPNGAVRLEGQDGIGIPEDVGDVAGRVGDSNYVPRWIKLVLDAAITWYLNQEVK